MTSCPKYSPSPDFSSGRNYICYLQTWGDGMLGCRRLLAAPLRALSGRAPSPYAVLGLPTTAEAKEIKETFYRLSKEHHPDLNKEQGSLDKFR